MKTTMTIQECEKEIMQAILAAKDGTMSSVDSSAVVVSLLNQIVHLQRKEIEELKLVQMRKFEEFVDATEIRNTGRHLKLVKG